MDTFVCASTLDSLQAQYDEIVAEIAKAVFVYDNAPDGDMRRHLALRNLDTLNKRKCMIEKEFDKHC